MSKLILITRAGSPVIFEGSIKELDSHCGALDRTSTFPVILRVQNNGDVYIASNIQATEWGLIRDGREIEDEKS